MWRALGSPGQHRGASEGRALGPKSLRVTNGKGKGKKPSFMLNQAGKPNAAERRKSSRAGSRLDEIGQARRRLYWRALRCSKQLKRPPQTARRPAEEQAERGAARTPALFSSANARTTARLLRGSSFLPSFLCFVFTYFPLYAASRVGKGSSFLLLPSLLPLFAALAFIRTLRLSTQFI